MTRLGADATAVMLAEIKALGVTFICRYVSDFPWKNLTPAEAQRVSAAGIDLVTNWENDVNDWAGGRAQGAAYAQRALAQHKACGGPSDGSAWGIYFSVDMKVDPGDPTLHDYFRGINSVLGAQHTGAYAQTSVLRALRGLGLIGCGERGGTWRSMSTFGLPEGLGAPGEFDVEQTGQFNPSYDRNVANSTRFGQWRIGAPAPQAREDGEMPYLISVTPDPTGPTGNKSSGIFAVDGGSVAHVDGPSYPALKTRFGDPVPVSPAYYQALLNNRAAVQLDAAAVAAALARELPPPPTRITGALS